MPWLKRQRNGLPDTDVVTGADLQLARDRLLVRRMRQGDEKAMAEFCTTYFPRLYRYVLHRVPRPDDADDVVQVVVTNAARRIETYRGDATLYSWLIAICRRELSKFLGAASREGITLSLSDETVLAELVAELEAPALQRPDDASQRNQTIDRVRACLAALPPRHAEALELKYLQGYSSKEIAARFQMSDEAVQSLLARARRTFREACDDQLPPDMEIGNGERY